MAVDRSLPHAGIEFGGNGLPPISWPHWWAAAAIVGVAVGCVASLLFGGASGVAYGGAIAAVLVGLTLALPIKGRNYRLPEPAALRVGRDGLHVYTVVKGGRRVRTYVHLPWHTLGALTLTGTPRPALRIELTGAGGSADTRTLRVPEVGTAALVEAVAGYSEGRHRVADPASRVAPRFEVVLYGYDIEQVDALVRRVEAATSAAGAASLSAVRDELAAGPVLPEGRRGYERAQVDDFLRRVTLELGRRDAA